MKNTFSSMNLHRNGADTELKRSEICCAELTLELFCKIYTFIIIRVNNFSLYRNEITCVKLGDKQQAIQQNKTKNCWSENRVTRFPPSQTLLDLNKKRGTFREFNSPYSWLNGRFILWGTPDKGYSVSYSNIGAGYG